MLGVDGGGTKTHATVADERGCLLGFGVSGPSNWEDDGVRRWPRPRSQAAVREASERGRGGAPERVDGIDLRAGGDRLPVGRRERFERRVSRLRSGCGGPHRVVNDSFVALRAGTNHPWGVVVISGTGSVVAGRNPAGETFRTLGAGSRCSATTGSASEISAGGARAPSRPKLPRTRTARPLMTDLLCSHGGNGRADGADRGCRARPDRGRVRFAAAVDGGRRGAAIWRPGGSWSRRVPPSATSRGTSRGASAWMGREFELVLAGSMFRDGNRIMRAPIEVNDGRQGCDTTARSSR